ncbi:hypothetical protein VTK56DRAFT_2291 [Thermocarpiscus australiensis]
MADVVKKKPHKISGYFVNEVVKLEIRKLYKVRGRPELNISLKVCDYLLHTVLKIPDISQEQPYIFAAPIKIVIVEEVAIRG